MKLYADINFEILKNIFMIIVSLVTHSMFQNGHLSVILTIWHKTLEAENFGGLLPKNILVK